MLIFSQFLTNSSKIDLNKTFTLEIYIDTIAENKMISKR